MLQFNRKVEYALAIVAHLARASEGELHSARSVSERTRIPFDMVTKCLQRLHHQGLCQAVQGKHGGYRLIADPHRLSIGGFLEAVFEPVAIAECLSRPDGADCVLLGECDLFEAMQRLNRRIEALLDEVSLAEFLDLEAQGGALPAAGVSTSGDPAERSPTRSPTN